MSTVKCPSCGSSRPPILNPDTGEYVCPDCGHIYGPILEPFLPRSHDDYEKRVHSEKMGRNPDTTPKTVVRQHPIGSRVVRQRGGKKVQYDFFMTSIQREFNIPEYIVEEVRHLFWKLHATGVLKGRSHKLVVASLIYSVSQKYPNVQLPKETLEKIAQTNIKKVYRFYRFLQMNGYIETRKVQAQRSPSQYLPAIMSKIEQELRKDSEKNFHPRFLHQIPNALLAKSSNTFSKYLQGTKPNGVAAATLYFFLRLTGLRLNQDVVARIAGVSPLTIRRIIKQILKEMDISIKM